jgi:hypothetical protein
MKRLLLFALAPLLLFATSNASAQDAAPFAGHCFGDGTSTCLVPELSFDVVQLYVNGERKGTLSGGAVPVGAGYALLFGYDQWWTLGPAFHGVFNLAEKGTSMFQLTGGLTFLRYGHAGVVMSRSDGFNQFGVFAGLVAPIDLVTTAVADRKAKAVRAARAAAPPAPAEGSGS